MFPVYTQIQLDLSFPAFNVAGTYSVIKFGRIIRLELGMVGYAIIGLRVVMVFRALYFIALRYSAKTNFVAGIGIDKPFMEM